MDIEKIKKDIMSYVNNFSTWWLQTLLGQKTGNAGKSSKHEQLAQFALSGDLGQLRLLMTDPYLNFDQPNEEGTTPIFFAMRSASVPTVNFFLERGAQVERQNTYGQTPLFEAVRTNSTDFLNTVLALKSIDMHTQDENGQNVLHVSVKEGLLNAVMALIARDPTLATVADKQGKTPLMYAAEGGYINIVKALLSDTTLVNTNSHDGWTALMYATQKGALEIISLLLAHGAELESIDNDFKQTPYLIACKMAHVEAAKLLVDRGARYDAVDYYQRTALHLAVETHNLEMVRFVLSTKVSLTAEDKFNLTAMQWAVVNSTPEILKLLTDTQKVRR